ncbi:uncharacterized protein LOC5515758 [Nematostella vectensis]|nr:uncharacterized protein LOC5515758 [Nematostella vectensis]
MNGQTLIVVSLFSFTLFFAVFAHNVVDQVDQKRNVREYNMLKELLGKPKGNPVAAEAVKGIKTTTRLHKLCPGKKPVHRVNLSKEWSEDATAYDKVICGLYTMKDEYKKRERHVAQILAGKHKDKPLEEQKKYLIEAVNKMAKAAGPLPRLIFPREGR